ncbi:MAG TPA: corrinoid protein, partial [Bacillota bacterium]|nr:corrinoid protein [Bacillota bacterium]
NPSSEQLMELKLAADLLVTKDLNSRNYLARFANSAPAAKTGTNSPVNQKDLPTEVAQAVIAGDLDRIGLLLKDTLQAGFTAEVLVDQYLIPAINRVGELFEKKQYFLPQLIQSAETMKKAFDILEPVLADQNAGSGKHKTKIVLATVKGDIHDIGKNLVALMMKNQGFEVYDLGKDVSATTIVTHAKDVDADLVGLSALMTTTMIGMKDVIELAKQEGLRAKFIIGGAVVNEAFAQEIGADGYSEDAYRAVKLAERLVKS